MRVIFLSIQLMISVVLMAQDTHYMRIGSDFSVKFNEYLPGGCDGAYYFTKQNDSVYHYQEYADYPDIGQVLKVKLKVEVDSVVLFGAFENRWGYLVSETEGAMVYNGDDPDAVYYSDWKRAGELSENRKFDLRFFGYKKGFVNNNPPKMAKEKMKVWRDELKRKNAFWANPRALQVFCTKMKIKVVLYRNGKPNTYYLEFDRRIGEC